MNELNIQDYVEYVVDINPYKQGKYIAGVGQKIVMPDFLKKYRPDIIIVMNSIYLIEIQRIVQELGLSSEIKTA